MIRIIGAITLNGKEVNYKKLDHDQMPHNTLIKYRIMPLSRNREYSYDDNEKKRYGDDSNNNNKDRRLRCKRYDMKMKDEKREDLKNEDEKREREIKKSKEKNRSKKLVQKIAREK